MTEIAHSFEEQVAEAALEPDSGKRLKLVAKARKSVKKIVGPKKPMGAPLKLSKAMADTICRRIANGETLTSFVGELGVTLECVYNWLRLYPDFSDDYRVARISMAKTMADELLDEAKASNPEKAMLLKVKGGIVQWATSKFAPKDFGDTKRIELSGEVHHKHTHELSDDQKRRIAESWLISKEPDTPRITATTTGPDLEAVAVRSIYEGEQGEHPKRKRSAQDRGKAPGKGKRPKLTVDSIVE